MHRYITLGDVVYLYFAANDTDGSGADGATPLYYVRLAGASASAAPIESGTPSLLSHATYPAGLFEVAIDTSTTDYAANASYGVFCTLAVDGQNPSGFIGSFSTGTVPADVREYGGSAGTFSGGRPEVNATHWGGTAVAAANVLIDGAITAAKIASDAITAAKIATGALTAAKFAAGAFDAVWTVAARLLTAGTNIVLAKGTGVTGFNDLDAAGIRTATGLASANVDTQLSALAALIAAVPDAVWDELLSGHATSGSAGAGLTAAGSAGDPWSTALPGSYGAGTAGKIIGDNVNATISSRLASASYTAPSNSAIALIQAQTDKLTFGPSNYLQVNVKVVNSVLIDGAGTEDDPWGPA